MELALQMDLVGSGNGGKGTVAEPFPAPAGYRWQPETYNGETVTYMGQACYYLERIT